MSPIGGGGSLFSDSWKLQGVLRLKSRSSARSLPASSKLDLGGLVCAPKPRTTAQKEVVWILLGSRYSPKSIDSSWEGSGLGLGGFVMSEVVAEHPQQSSQGSCIRPHNPQQVLKCAQALPDPQTIPQNPLRGAGDLASNSKSGAS